MILGTHRPGSILAWAGEHGTVSPVRPRARDLTRSTVTPCRRTKISAALAASPRASSASQPDTRTMNR